MTILSDAEQIRDEVIPKANTPERVGDCLVDIANALTALAGGAINSASCVLGGTTTSTTTGDPVAVVGESAYEVFTGSGITISEQDGYSYFSGLDATHAYALTYTCSVLADEAAVIEFSSLDAGLNYITGVLATGGSVTATSRPPFTYTPTVTGVTAVVLGVGRIDSVDPLVLDISQISARCVDLGLVV